MKTKETYTLLDMDIIEFDNTDVIVTSTPIETEENEIPPLVSKP
jgi:hypothetical protein